MLRLLATILIALPGAALASEPVDLTVTGDVAVTCALPRASSEIPLPSLTAAGRASFDVALSCNAPFTLKVRSENGALTAGEIPVQGKFASAVPYEITLNLDLDDGSALSIKNCPSAEAREGGNCGIANTAGRTAIQKTAAVLVEWPEQESPLVAGEYGDVLTVEIEFAP